VKKTNEAKEEPFGRGPQPDHERNERKILSGISNGVIAKKSWSRSINGGKSRKAIESIILCVFSDIHQ